MENNGQQAQQKNNSAPADLCFVIMQFGGFFDTYYEKIYIPAIRATDLAPKRVDDLYRPSAIINDIWEYTNKAKVILADLTGKNSNVFYELGLAHALAKPAILVTENINDVPFDLRSLRILEYNKNLPDWSTQLRENIESAIKATLASPGSSLLPFFRRTGSSTPSSWMEVDPASTIYRGKALGADYVRALKVISKLYERGTHDDEIISVVSIGLGVVDSWVWDQLNHLKKSSGV